MDPVFPSFAQGPIEEIRSLVRNMKGDPASFKAMSPRMRTRLQHLTELKRPKQDRRGAHVAGRPTVVPVDPEARVREAGGPEDVAHYGCECGYQFEAAVTTSVSCPHCGSAQAW